MKLGETIDDVVGLAFGVVIAAGIVGFFGTVIVLSYFADTRLFAERAPARR